MTLINSLGLDINKTQINYVGAELRVWYCVVCGFIYDESIGLPEEGIAAGTLFEDIPNDWVCTDCGVSKADFVLMEY